MIVREKQGGERAVDGGSNDGKRYLEPMIMISEDPPKRNAIIIQGMYRSSNVTGLTKSGGQHHQTQFLESQPGEVWSSPGVSTVPTNCSRDARSESSKRGWGDLSVIRSNGIPSDALVSARERRSKNGKCGKHIPGYRMSETSIKRCLRSGQTILKPSSSGSGICSAWKCVAFAHRTRIKVRSLGRDRRQ